MSGPPDGSSAMNGLQENHLHFASELTIIDDSRSAQVMPGSIVAVVAAIPVRASRGAGEPRSPQHGPRGSGTWEVSRFSESI